MLPKTEVGDRNAVSPEAKTELEWKWRDKQETIQRSATKAIQDPETGCRNIGCSHREDVIAMFRHVSHREDCYQLFCITIRNYWYKLWLPRFHLNKWQDMYNSGTINGGDGF